MYVEERIYQIQIGKVPEYLKIYEQYGLPVQLKHLPHLVGYYYVEVGPQNTVVHLWAYESLDQRDQCRTRMQADPAWAVYTDKGRPLMVKQETRVMKCAPFFVERLKKMLAAVK